MILFIINPGTFNKQTKQICGAQRNVALIFFLCLSQNHIFSFVFYLLPAQSPEKNKASSYLSFRRDFSLFSFFYLLIVQNSAIHEVSNYLSLEESAALAQCINIWACSWLCVVTQWSSEITQTENEKKAKQLFSYSVHTHTQASSQCSLHIHIITHPRVKRST
jgi:hypothetical protein